MTPHNQASKEDVASLVLMPGDPLRAKYIAEKWLENPRLINSVRNMLGYTGTYNGIPVTVMGSGMGMPSIGIYSYELYDQYDVKAILRVGSCGAYSPDLHIFDVLLANDCWSSSSYAMQTSQDPSQIKKPSASLQEGIAEWAKKNNEVLHQSRIHSSDAFYHSDNTDAEEAQKQGCTAVEMESFALFHNAEILNKEAACLLTVSDSFVYPEENTSAEEREKSFDKMITLALKSLTAWGSQALSKRKYNK